ncbi:MAG: F0F1 ATP synthase subunit delta [Tissierella sp.]|nr:F0F1 ATP synthase subunit delta [Tissierella sp.]
MAKLIGNRYASSLFEVGLELGKTEDFYEELESINNLFNTEEKLFQIFIHPRISKDEKKSLVNQILKNGISKEVLNFLYIIIDKRREKNLFEIIEEYNNIYDEHNGIIDIVAVTAVGMNENAAKKLQVVLENKLSKKIRLKNELDHSIIGGVLLKMNNKVIDATLLSQLKSMEAIIKDISI